MADALTIFPPRHPLRGRASPPGSKSITNRALLLAALSRGTSRLTGALKSDDTRYMADALRAMGVCQWRSQTRPASSSPPLAGCTRRRYRSSSAMPEPPYAS